MKVWRIIGAWLVMVLAFPAADVGAEQTPPASGFCLRDGQVVSQRQGRHFALDPGFRPRLDAILKRVPGAEGAKRLRLEVGEINKQRCRDVASVASALFDLAATHDAKGDPECTRLGAASERGHLLEHTWRAWLRQWERDGARRAEADAFSGLGDPAAWETARQGYKRLIDGFVRRIERRFDTPPALTKRPLVLPVYLDGKVDPTRSQQRREVFDEAREAALRFVSGYRRHKRVLLGEVEQRQRAARTRLFADELELVEARATLPAILAELAQIEEMLAMLEGQQEILTEKERAIERRLHAVAAGRPRWAVVCAAAVRTARDTEDGIRAKLKHLAEGRAFSGLAYSDLQTEMVELSRLISERDGRPAKLVQRSIRSEVRERSQLFLSNFDYTIPFESSESEGGREPKYSFGVYLFRASRLSPDELKRVVEEGTPRPLSRIGRADKLGGTVLANTWLLSDPSALLSKHTDSAGYMEAPGCFKPNAQANWRAAFAKSTEHTRQYLSLLKTLSRRNRAERAKQQLDIEDLLAEQAAVHASRAALRQTIEQTQQRRAGPQGRLNSLLAKVAATVEAKLSRSLTFCRLSDEADSLRAEWDRVTFSDLGMGEVARSTWTAGQTIRHDAMGQFARAERLYSGKRSHQTRRVKTGGQGVQVSGSEDPQAFRIDRVVHVGTLRVADTKRMDVSRFRNMFIFRLVRADAPDIPKAIASHDSKPQARVGKKKRRPRRVSKPKRSTRVLERPLAGVAGAERVEQRLPPTAPREQVLAEDMSVQRSACAGGNGAACYRYGLACESGQAGLRNRARARDHFAKACDAGFELGCHRYGLYHLNGWGGPQSTRKARLFFEKACAAEVRKACELLQSL